MLTVHLWLPRMSVVKTADFTLVLAMLPPELLHYTSMDVAKQADVRDGAHRNPARPFRDPTPLPIPLTRARLMRWEG